MSSLAGPPPKGPSPPTASNIPEGSNEPPGTLTQEQRSQVAIGTALAQNAGQRFLVLSTPGGPVYAEYGKQVSQAKFESDYQGFISSEQQQGAQRINTQPEFLPVDISQSVADQVRYVQAEEGEIQASQKTLNKANPQEVGLYNAQVEAYNANVKTITGEVQRQQQVFQSYVGKSTPASQLVSAFQGANLDVPTSLAALARANPNALVALEKQSGKGGADYVLKYQTSGPGSPQSGGGGILGDVEDAAGTAFGYLTEGMGYAGFYLYSLSYTAGGELGSLISGKPFQGVRTFSGQPLPAPTPQQAQAFGAVGLESAIVINLAVLQPETLIGAGISVGFEEAATGGKATPAEVIGAAAGGSVFAGVGYGVSLVVLKAAGAYVEVGAPGAGAVESFLKNLGAPGLKAAATRAAYGAATNVALTLPFTKDPTQLAESAAIGAGVSGLLPGAVGTVKEATGLGGAEAVKVPQGTVEEQLGYKGKAGEAPEVYRTEPLEKLGGKSLEVIGDVTVNPDTASELEKAYVNEGEVQLAHATLKPFFETKGEVLLTAKPGEATGFRQEVESLGLYFAPSDEGDVIRAYGGYIGVGEGYSGESPKIVLGGKPSVVSVEEEVTGEFRPRQGETAAETVERTFTEGSGKVGLPVENYVGRTTERQLITPTSFKSGLTGKEYPGTILETLGVKQKFYVKELPEGVAGRIPGVRSLLSKYTFASVTPGRLKPVTAASELKGGVDLAKYGKAFSKGKGVLSVEKASVPASPGVSSMAGSSEVSSLSEKQSEYYSEPYSKPSSPASVSERSVSSQPGSASVSSVDVSPENFSVSEYSLLSESVYSLPSSPTESPPTSPYPFPLFPRKKAALEVKALDYFGVRFVRNYLASSSKEIDSALKREGILE